MIAQAVTANMDPTLIALTGFSTLSTAVLLVFKVYDLVTGKGKERNIQQPLRVVEDPRVLTKEEHVEHCSYMDRRVIALESRTDRIERKMETDKNAIIEAGEQRMINIHNRINDLQTALAHQPAQVVALLKNTKGLIP